MSAFDYPRNAARFSIIAPYAAFMLMCVNRQLETDLGAAADVAGYIASSISILLMVAAAVAGVYALLAGRRAKNLETVQIAVLGLITSCGSIGLTLVAVYIVYSR